MKIIKYITILLILMMFFSCKKSTLTITGPGPELFLSKMENNKWEGVTVENNGNKITINTGGEDKNYTFENNILGVGGIYKDDNPSGDKGYMVTVPAGDKLYTVDMTEEGKNAINDILTIVGEDKVLGIMANIASNGGVDGSGDIDIDKLVGSSNITSEQKSQIEEIVKNLPSGSFGVQITCILLTVSIGHILITEVSVRMWAAANIEEFSPLRTKKHGQTCTTDMYFTFLKGMISEC